MGPSTVSIGVGCYLFPLGTRKFVRVEGRMDVGCGSWLPVTGFGKKGNQLGKNATSRTPTLDKLGMVVKTQRAGNSGYQG